jgi:hypothetical protein
MRYVKPIVMDLGSRARSSASIVPDEYSCVAGETPMMGPDCADCAAGGQAESCNHGANGGGDICTMGTSHHGW